MKSLSLIILSLAICMPGLSQSTQDLQESGYQGPPFQADNGLTNRRSVNKHMEVLSVVDLPPRLGSLPDVSDVWVHGDYAYVGGRSYGDVNIIDVTDPYNPALVVGLPGIFQSSSPQDVKVASLDTPLFTGDLLAVSNEGGGFQLFDVTDLAEPVLLYQEITTLGCCRLNSPHNTYIVTKDNAAYLLLSMDFREYVTRDLGLPQEGDLLIYDITDPSNPTRLADWGANKDLGLPIDPWLDDPCDLCRGEDFASAFLHDVWASDDGNTAYLSYWDAGLILLDISDPSNPAFIGRGVEPPAYGGDEGNAHNAVPANGGDLVIVADEDFTARPWGHLRFFDTSDPTNPVQISTFAIGEALSQKRGAWSAHNVVVDGTLAYVSWYFGGIRVVDFSDPTEPQEVAAWAPSDGSIWGVYYDNGLIYASDMAGRLWILRQTDSNGMAKNQSTQVDESPSEFELLPAYPNPFNPSTTIAYDLPEASHVTLSVTNLLGQTVRVLASGSQPSGRHQVSFDASGLPSGVYLYRLEAADYVATGRMVLLK